LNNKIIVELVRITNILYEKCKGNFKSVSEHMAINLNDSEDFIQLSSNLKDNQTSLLYLLSLLYNLAVRGMIINRKY
jgi:hypothetical protein